MSCSTIDVPRADGSRSATGSRSLNYVYDDEAETWTVLGKPDSEVDAAQSSV